MCERTTNAVNNEPNTTHHAVGDLVIHDADAKTDEMLMRVIGYTSDGKVKTKYANASRGVRTYVNPIEVLHDPDRPDVRARWQKTGGQQALKVWLLELKERAQYEQVETFVVAAEDEGQARKLAADACGGEGERAWLDDSYSECLVLTATGLPRVVVRNFKSG